MGNEIVGAKSIRRSRVPGVLGRFRGNATLFWKYEVGQLFDEARMSNYLGFGERGAAICLRIILEKVINIHLLGRDPKHPRRFPNLERAMKQAVDNHYLDNTSHQTIAGIKLLGDAAAHPAAYGNYPVTAARVDYAMLQLEGLLNSLGVV
jgi:hypothetical protein